MPPLGAPLAQYSKFNLNPAGVAGFFGGEEAVSAMASVHLYKGRRWLGWYNAPGSGTMAKEFGRIANSRFWDALFPGPNDPPAVVFGLHGKKGPRYIAALSRMSFQTGHLGYLTMERSKELNAMKIKGRETLPINVAYLAMKNVDDKVPVKLLPFKTALWGLIPITVSVVTCVMCSLVYDWFSFSVILAGMITSGLTSAVIGEGRLVIESVMRPFAGAPPGHGILIGEDEVVVIKGAEGDVNVITKGRFDLVMAGAKMRYHAIGLCSLLLLVPVLLQLLLIPQGTFFGQLMFLVSLGVSWVYNFYLSSLEREKLHTDIFFEALGSPQMLRFQAGTRTTMATFVCLLLFHGVERSSPEKDRDLRIKILDSCLPNDTVIWRRWKEKVVEQHLNIDDDAGNLPYLAENGEDQVFLESDRALLRALLNDAGTAFREYLDCRGILPDDSSHQKVE
ncbi:hypothetical protein L210DRAFT_3586053 [Boletus edulis BED1]|uniref:Uncharacterized protein n=1 Tax=Boletus edulis BED1 TaxID=1328754 RepID=A0AAD4BBC0_BOLED|nr:hypothetical protein L210DRAFT_3586053 [Boletus edulis BED1]